MGIVYVAIGFVVLAILLFMFHRLSRPPGVTSQAPPKGLAEEAAEWLESQS